MTSDEHTTNRPTPGGSAFQETGMDDYLTRVAEAVRDACAAEAFMETTLAVEYVSAACPGEIISNMILNNIDLPAVIASVPRPEPVAEVAETSDRYFKCDVLVGCMPDVGTQLYAEPVAAQVAVPDGWKVVAVEPSIAACIIGSNAAGGAIDGRQCAVVYRAMLAAAPEAPQTADDDFELTCTEPPARDDRKAIKRLSEAVSAICAQAGESEDEFTKWLADGGMLELLESGNKAMKLEKAVEAAGQQNAALVAALEHLEHNARSSGAEMGLALDVARAALASAKGGAQ